MKLLLAAGLLALFVWWSTRRRRAAASTQSAIEITQLLAFFDNAPRLAGVPVDEIVAAVGPWTTYDDWDWGRFVYEWIRPGLRIRVVTYSHHVRTIERLDPSDPSRFGTVLETLLETTEKGETTASSDT